MFWLPFAACIAALGSLALATGSTQCPRPDLCFSLDFADPSLVSQSGGVFIQMMASTAFGRINLTQEHAGTGANYFFVWPVEGQSYVDGIVRQAVGEEHVDYRLDFLEGSGVKDGKMTAKFQCSTCDSKSGGSLHLAMATPITSWIWTYQAGHSSSFAAPVSGSVNFYPFAAESTTTNAVLAPSMVSRATPTGHAPASQGLPPRRVIRLYTAHAVLACLAWAFIFPLGGILIRICSFRNLVWVHAWLQIFGLCLYTAAVGMGVELSISPKHWRMNNKHVIIGMIIFILFLFQAASGYVHHLMFKRYMSRTTWSYVHVWTGRLCVTVGMMNAGFGFQITKKKAGTWQVMVYTVCAVLVWMAYVTSAVVGERRKKKQVAAC